jgi:type IV pilus assembly protein PilO
MSSTKSADKRQGFDVTRLTQDFQGLNPSDPGAWPVAPKILVFVALLATTLALAWWFDWRVQAETLTRAEAEELKLREDWKSKKRQAVNLEAHKRQLAEIDREFGALLRQLPNRAEMDSLLAEINQAGLGRGLQFELFKPRSSVVKDFYAEMPIDIRIVGGYHDIGAFAADVAKLPRIVTLNNVSISDARGGKLKLEAVANTYRYLDDGELAAQRKAAEPQRNARSRRR